MRWYQRVCVAGLLLMVACAAPAAQTKKGTAAKNSKAAAKAAPAKAKDDYRPDIVAAVKAAAAKDCGCGHCAAKGCEPCHGKNCYYCVAKALVTQECGCGACGAKGCAMCGPGCDVCKFHLAPVADAKAKEKEKEQKKK